jgi:hypothetical protein
MTERVEVRAYTDGWLHYYHSEDLASGQPIVTPGCAENDPFYGVDHERKRISGPIKRVERGELCRGCCVWARKRRLTPALAPSPAPRRVTPLARHAEPDTTVLPLTGTIRGVL